MNLRLATFFLIASIVALSAAVVTRFGRERALLEKSFLEQKNTLERGLNEKWQNYLAEANDSGRLKQSYTLVFDALGSRLVTSFFPREPSKLNWNTYRELRDSGKKSEAQAFLSAALAMPMSWDRTLALKEWNNVTGALPEDSLSQFERSLFSPEAEAAYRLIFDCNEKGVEPSALSQKTRFDCTHVRVLPSGEVEYSVPSVREVRDVLLDDFLKNEQLFDVKMSQSPWQLELLSLPTASKAAALYEIFLYAASLAALLLSLWHFRRSVLLETQRLNNRVGFLSQVVHELKTPLASLKLHVQLAKKLGPDADTFGAIDASVDRLDRLFNQVALLNRPEQSSSSLDVKSGEWLAALLNDIAALFPPDAVEIGEIDPSTFLCDGPRLEVVLRNLVGNAVKYGTRAIVSTRITPKSYIICVEDRGDGVPTEISKKIFSEFFRSDEARRVSPDGLGIGLFLAQKLAREMDGELVLANPGQKHARFELSLRRVTDA